MRTASMYLTILPILLSVLIVGFSRGFFLPRPEPGSFPGTEKGNDTDAIVIENTDGDNSTLPLFPITPPSTCPKEQSCLGRCSSTRQFQNITTKEKSLRCFCDPECNTVFHDCCADYERYCQETETQRGKSPTVRWGCGKVVGQDFGIWMIEKCTHDWPYDEVRSKCENNSTEIALKDDPTLVVDESSNMFRNRHCARCNNVQKFTCLRLEMNNGSSQNISNRQPRLSIKDMNKDRSLADECRRIRLNHSSRVGLRYCYKIQSSCKDTNNSTTVRNCRDGKTGLVSFKNETYKNFYCLKCNHRYSFGLIPAKVSCGPHFSPDSRFNFAAMFRLPASPHADTNRCSSGFFYDNTARICRKLLTISELNSNDSSFLTKYAIRLHYTRNQKPYCFGYNAYNKNSTKEIKNVILGKLLNGFNKAFMQIIESNLWNTNWTLSDIVINLKNTNYTTVMFQILAIKRGINETEIFSPVKDLKLGLVSFFYDQSESNLCSYSLSVKSSRTMNCLDKNQSNVAITMDKVSIFDNGTLFHQATRENFNSGEYILYKRYNQTRLATCKKSLPTNCKYILKSDSNWKLFSNRSIYSNVTNMWFEFGEYSIIDGVVWLCLTNEISSKSAKEEQSKTIHETVLRYSSLFCLSISILGLILLLFIYAITPALRNLPGKNLMLLCCVLALAQFLWLLQEQAFQFQKVCIALSSMLHFLFLASFSCATSIALLSFLTFRAIANGKLGQSNEGKAFLRYILFSLGFPCVWVTLFLLLDCYGIFLLDYGSIKGHCWLGNIRGLYVSFFAPVFTLLCINLALLLATVNVIRKCSRASQKLAESTKSSVNRIHVWIYIRMASLMGFTWLLGVFQIVFPRVLVFEYLFVFVNGLQGFYIALAFLCTDNVKKILSKRIGSVSDKTRSTSK